MSCYFILSPFKLFSFFGNASTLKLNCFLVVFVLQEETLVPAVNGTLNVLRSCKKNPFLKRVVLTSSSSAVRIRDDAQPNISLDETIWSSVPLCEKMQVIHAWNNLVHTLFLHSHLVSNLDLKMLISLSFIQSYGMAWRRYLPRKQHGSSPRRTALTL